MIPDSTQLLHASVPAVRSYLLGLQQRICDAVADIDGIPFMDDAWEKAAGEPLQGNGITRILEQGQVFERAGCGFSHVRGRMLAAFPGTPRQVCWFGGGMDLTPYYGFEEDAVHFHASCKAALEPFGADLFPRFKRWCDEYFFLKHRQEQRGVGGIFFDDFGADNGDAAFALQRSVGDAFLGAYLPIVQRRASMPYGDRERQFQLFRRGRYVEFNLVWDRGTHFGLQSGGRTESILLSMPPLVRWSYQERPQPGTPEHDLVHHFLVRRDWV